MEKRVGYLVQALFFEQVILLATFAISVERVAHECVSRRFIGEKFAFVLQKLVFFFEVLLDKRNRIFMCLWNRSVWWLATGGVGVVLMVSECEYLLN